MGEGAYGTVYKAVHIERKDEIVALKKIKMNFEDEGLPTSALREISILMLVSNKLFIYSKNLIMEIYFINIIRLNTVT